MGISTPKQPGKSLGRPGNEIVRHRLAKLEYPQAQSYRLQRLNSGLLTADRVSRFYPKTLTLCGLCMFEA
jgi:hypothetical protein